MNARAGMRVAWLAALLLGALAAVPVQAADTVVYYHTDALHSVTVVTNAQGQVLERTHYAPYGTVLNRGLRDGPGYTGHQEDAATGLVYMQQRYYDPATGRFLSADPVQADDKGGSFNRYWYAKDNPYRYTDPDGRKIEYVLEDGATEEDRTATMNYLGGSSTARHEISTLANSKLTYTIKFDRTASEDRYNDKTRTVTVNPTLGLKVKSSGKIQSPAIGAGHEISHAAEHDRVGTATFEKNLVAPVLSVKPMGQNGMSVTYGVSPEEKRATSVESSIAHQLGDNARKNYTDTSGQVRTCGATSTKQC